jgi:hypothetical protein
MRSATWKGPLLPAPTLTTSTQTRSSALFGTGATVNELGFRSARGAGRSANSAEKCAGRIAFPGGAIGLQFHAEPANAVVYPVPLTPSPLSPGSQGPAALLGQEPVEHPEPVVDQRIPLPAFDLVGVAASRVQGDADPRADGRVSRPAARIGHDRVDGHLLAVVGAELDLMALGEIPLVAFPPLLAAVAHDLPDPSGDAEVALESSRCRSGDSPSVGFSIPAGGADACVRGSPGMDSDAIAEAIVARIPPGWSRA